MYYEYGGCVGTVDSSDGELTITLSDPVEFGNNKDESITFTIVGLSDMDYAVLYFNTSYADQVVPYSGPLTVVYVVVSGAPAAAVVEVRSTSIWTASALVYNFRGTRMNNDTLIAVYTDANNNYALTSVVIDFTRKVDSDGTGRAEILFGSTLALTTGQTLMELSNYLLMDIDISSIPMTSSSDDAVSFIVLYSDITNDGKLTSVLGEVSWIILAFLLV